MKSSFTLLFKRKQKLIEMALLGHDRPSSASKDLETKRLGQTLNDSICAKLARKYDEVFTNTILGIRPDWRIGYGKNKNPKGRSIHYKEAKPAIMSIARSGGSRPCCSPVAGFVNLLGVALSAATNTRSGSFDPDFNEKIRYQRPDWFLNENKISKRTIRSMALRGLGRPSRGDSDANLKRLAYRLRAYVNKKDKCFCPDFYIEITTLRPDWFSRSTTK